MESSSLPSLPEENHADNDNNNNNDVPSPSSSAFSSIPHRPPSTLASSNKYSPLNWSDYYDREDDVCIPNSDDVGDRFLSPLALPVYMKVFHVYMAGTEGPVVFCLHGGGFSGLSFALSAKIIKEKARVVAMDLRGHGKSSTENELDLSTETLCSDVLAVLKTMYGDSPPAIVFVGHSMGGSVAVHVAAKKALPSLAGLVVVDVVEGTAMASLIHMQKILSNRMQYFPTIEKAYTTKRLLSQGKEKCHRLADSLISMALQKRKLNHTVQNRKQETNPLNQGYMTNYKIRKLTTIYSLITSRFLDSNPKFRTPPHAEECMSISPSLEDVINADYEDCEVTTKESLMNKSRPQSPTLPSIYSASNLLPSIVSSNMFLWYGLDNENDHTKDIIMFFSVFYILKLGSSFLGGLVAPVRRETETTDSRRASRRRRVFTASPELSFSHRRWSKSQSSRRRLSLPSIAVGGVRSGRSSRSGERETAECRLVEWSVKGGSTRNIESARVSIPSTLTYDDSKKCHCFIPFQLHKQSTIGGNGTILERLQTPRSTAPAQQDGPIGGVYELGPAAVGGARYEGLSEKFLSSPVPKLLLLAGTDRLDRALTIGQMQGKFQMVVVRHTGHAIQEDVPDEFATLVLNFISHNRIGPRGVE
ncbi:hypothetical protein RJ639_002203, partial [Escallonia herrerae]